MQLVELKKLYDEFYEANHGAEDFEKRRIDWIEEHVNIVPYVPFAQKVQAIMAAVDTIVSEQDEMLVKDPIEMDVIVTMAIVNQYTDIEYDLEEKEDEDGGDGIKIYDMLSEIGIITWITYDTRQYSGDIHRFADWLYDEVNDRIDNHNSTSAILNRRIKAIEDVVVNAVEKFGDMDFRPDKMQEIAETVERINSTEEEVKELTGKKKMRYFAPHGVMPMRGVF